MIAESFRPTPLGTIANMTTAAELILEEQRNKVAGQEAEFNGVRSRATAVASASGLIAALLAPHFYSQHDVGSFVALGLTVVVIALGVMISFPKTWGSGSKLENAITWERTYGMHPSAPAMVARQITEALREVFDNNAGVIDTLNGWFACQCGLFGLQLLAWSAAIIWR
jgi:hypothetical protein